LAFTIGLHYRAACDHTIHVVAFGSSFAATNSPTNQDNQR